MTNCPNCKKTNEAGSQFCNNCGLNLMTYNFSANTNTQTSDILLLIFIIISFLSAIVQFIIQKIYIDWYDGPTRYIQGFMWIVQNISFILIPLAIKKMPVKVAGIVITVVLTIYWIITNVSFMLR